MTFLHSDTRHRRPSHEYHYVSAVPACERAEAPPTGVGDRVGAVGWALGVGGDDRGGCSSGGRLDGGGHRVDGEGGGGGARRCRLNHGHLPGLLALRVGRHALAVHWFGGCARATSGQRGVN